jgi:hypothetical protein
MSSLGRVEHHFSLLLERRGDDAVVSSACGSGGVREREGVPVVEFQRSAATLADAVVGAIRDVEGAGSGWRVVRVEPDELVSASAIARRLGRTRQSVAQLVAGQRGPGGFPPPAVWVDGAARLWRWSDVAEWCSVAIGTSLAVDRLAAEFLAMLNGELQARRHRERLAALAAPGLDPGSERFEVEVAFPQLGQGRRWRGPATEPGDVAWGSDPAAGV